MKSNRRIGLLLGILAVLWLVIPFHAQGSSLYVLGTFRDQHIGHNINGLASAYGLDLRKIENPTQVERSTAGAPLALVVSSSGLRDLKKDELSALLMRVQSGSLNVMVVFEGPSIESVPVAADVTMKVSNEKQAILTFAKSKTEDIRELAGIRLPVTLQGGTVLFEGINRKISKWEKIAWIENENSEDGGFLLRKRIGSGAIYLTTASSIELTTKDEVFAKSPAILPYVIMIQSTYGERVWHRKQNHANLTIDDPWLREPYGNLSYAGLLSEMEKANFHTTIAMIPWNYGRSENEVVEMFRNNRPRYSVCIHGNNHDVNEFDNYEKHPLDRQEADIRQALARMNKFQEITGIHYDRVMVFPRGIAPEKTIELLSKYHLLASPNSRITPRGNETSVGVEDIILPATVRYYNFPLLKRYSPRADKNIIALMMYFKKPVLLYTHQDYFTRGIGAFNETAHYVNEQSKGTVEWTNLTGISEGLYLEKKREDGAYDVWTLSSSARIRNNSKKTKRIFLSRITHDVKKIDKLRIGSATYHKGIEKELKRARDIKPGQQLLVEMVYREPAIEPAADLEVSSCKAKIVRALADFRDIYLSRSGVGRTVIAWYEKLTNGTGGY